MISNTESGDEKIHNLVVTSAMVGTNLDQGRFSDILYVCLRILEITHMIVNLLRLWKWPCT